MPGLPGGWELRVPPYRVYYDVDGAASEVRVQAVGHKPREKVRILGEEM